MKKIYYFLFYKKKLFKYFHLNSLRYINVAITFIFLFMIIIFRILINFNNYIILYYIILFYIII